MADLMKPKLTLAIVVTYHRPALLHQCLEALFGQRLEPSQRLEVLVVDNACSDTTPQLLEQWRLKEPRLHVLRLRRNGSGAGGFHSGLRWAFCGRAPPRDARCARKQRRGHARRTAGAAAALATLTPPFVHK